VTNSKLSLLIKRGTNHKTEHYYYNHNHNKAYNENNNEINKEKNKDNIEIENYENDDLIHQKIKTKTSFFSKSFSLSNLKGKKNKLKDITNNGLFNDFISEMDFYKTPKLLRENKAIQCKNIIQSKINLHQLSIENSLYKLHQDNKDKNKDNKHNNPHINPLSLSVPHTQKNKINNNLGDYYFPNLKVSLNKQYLGCLRTNISNISNGINSNGNYYGDDCNFNNTNNTKLKVLENYDKNNNHLRVNSVNIRNNFLNFSQPKAKLVKNIETNNIDKYKVKKYSNVLLFNGKL